MARGFRPWSVAVVLMATANCLTGCRETNSSRRVAADDLARAADACLIDVRDHDITWERSTNCQSLAGLAGSYISLGHFQSEPAEVRVIAERARATAWMARQLHCQEEKMCRFGERALCQRA